MREDLKMSLSIERETPMRLAIEEALKQAASKPGAPEVELEGWGRGVDVPELYVRVGDQHKVLEVSEPFLKAEPNEKTLRKVAAAARGIVERKSERFQLFHFGAFEVWENRVRE